MFEFDYLKIWKDLMKQVQVDTQVMVVIEIDKMAERLKKAYSLLVAIQKGLNAVSSVWRDFYSLLINIYFSIWTRNAFTSRGSSSSLTMNS